MKELNKNHVGLLFGSLVGAWHVIWSVLVFLGWAKLLVDWVLWLHFISLPITFQAFDLTRAVLLVVVASLVGFAVGWVSTWLWNMLVKKA